MKPTPLDPEPAWDLQRAGRIIATRLIELFESEGGELTPELMQRLHDRLLDLSMTLGQENLHASKKEDGFADASKVDQGKAKTTWILSGFMEAIENHRLPPLPKEN